MMPKIVNIKGTIVSDSSKWIYDFFGIESTSPKDVLKAIEECEKDNDTIILKVNSPGGSVYVASDIYEALKSTTVKTEADITGICASAATIIANGVDIVRASPLSQYMMHKCISSVYGNADDMLKAAEVLSTTDKAIANTYALKSGKTIEEIIQLMKDTTYMTPQEAIKNGFVDEMLFDDNKVLTNIITNAYSNSQLGIVNSGCPMFDNTFIEHMMKIKDELLNHHDSDDFFNEKEKVQKKLNLLKLGGVKND